jgi:ubiquinone/menaquinone biosynthesis C-methylase UbiE
MYNKKHEIQSNSEKYYDKLYNQNLDARWDDAPGKKVILAAFVDNIRTQKNTILDIGCGNGFFLNTIKKTNPVSGFEQMYVGIDFSEVAIEKAKKLYPGITFEQMDATAITFSNNLFDIIISYGSIEHIKNPLEALKNVQRVLKEDSLFFMMIPSLDYYRNDRNDEGWYEDLDENKQMQWNYLRSTWEDLFLKAGLEVADIMLSKKYGANKPGVFFFGSKT